MIFLSIPIIYKMLNDHYAVPHYADGNTLYDDHSRSASASASAYGSVQTTSTHADANEEEEGKEGTVNAVPTIPETFDIDVAIINQSVIGEVTWRDLTIEEEKYKDMKHKSWMSCRM